MSARTLIIAHAHAEFRDNWTVANGYPWDLETAEMVARGFDEVADGLKPWLGVYAGLETYEYMPAKRIKCNLELIVLIHINIAQTSSRVRHLDQAIDGVIKTLRQDVLCSKGAISTTLTSVETDEGDPGADDAGTMVAKFMVTYLRDEPTS